MSFTPLIFPLYAHEAIVFLLRTDLRFLIHCFSWIFLCATKPTADAVEKLPEVFIFAPHRNTFRICMQAFYHPVCLGNKRQILDDSSERDNA